MAKTPQQVAQKWGSRLKGAQTEIRDGVSQTQINPMERAADAADKWINRLQEAHSNGKFARRLRSVPMEVWRNNTINVGIPRIAAGVDKAMDDMEDFFAQLMNYQEGLSRTVDSMPDTTLEDSIARMNAWTRGMAEFSRS